MDNYYDAINDNIYYKTNHPVMPPPFWTTETDIFQNTFNLINYLLNNQRDE